MICWRKNLTPKNLFFRKFHNALSASVIFFLFSRACCRKIS